MLPKFINFNRFRRYSASFNLFLEEELYITKKGGLIDRKIFFNIKLLESEKKAMKELYEAFTPEIKDLMPSYWTINDSMRFLSSKNYKIPPTVKKMKQYLSWLKSIEVNGYSITEGAAELLVKNQKLAKFTFSKISLTLTF